jgi:hypothetical protein
MSTIMEARSYKIKSNRDELRIKALKAMIKIKSKKFECEQIILENRRLKEMNQKLDSLTLDCYCNSECKDGHDHRPCSDCNLRVK